MKIGIGLPATIPGTPGGLLLQWAREADQGPFSSLGVIDRVVFPNYSPLIALAGAAGATQRIRLMTTVLLAPLHSAALLAKQAASLDALSGGRLTLGLGVGAREDDFQAAGAQFAHRGSRFEEQLATMKRVWAGEPLSQDVGPIGPKPVQPGGPEILIGGYSPKAISRVARWADGFISGGAPPQQARQGYEVALNVWKEAGRNGTPRFVASAYYALGENARERGSQYIKTYYTGPLGDAISGSMPAGPDDVKATIQAYASMGADELMLWPTIASLDQVQLLVDALP